MANNYTRSAKVAHFANDSALTHGTSSHSQNPYANTNGGSINTNNSNHHLAHNNSSLSSNPANVSGTNRRGNKLSMEPLLMSPEINSIMGGDETRAMQQHASVNNDSLHYIVTIPAHISMVMVITIIITIHNSNRNSCIINTIVIIIIMTKI
ncbi:hypothetical protein EVAR_69647_1 [Eumeta japonica]|uniref:Uncharacterized protein n=1 Tax=Eumeta variegata TaxID=151549 RepID=A0A4C2AHJ2_EUMVA|nr:hypothetical protein EVAR_69647_1 [Eumeta japonica]